MVSFGWKIMIKYYQMKKEDLSSKTIRYSPIQRTSLLPQSDTFTFNEKYGSLNIICTMTIKNKYRDDMIFPITEGC
jgi:hypothetical protein